MSRHRLRQAIATRSGPAAVAPLIEAHAARLEQLSVPTWLGDAEAHARMHRNVQGLHHADAVTIGGGGLALPIAAHLAATPSLGLLGAHAAALAGTPLPHLPPPAAMAQTAIVSLFADVVRRLEPVFGDRAGIAVALPHPRSLAARLGIRDDAGWADEAVADVVRTLGADEPDLFFLLGDEPGDVSGLESLAEFFGAAAFALSSEAPHGLVVCSVEEFLAPTPPSRADAWLYTTRAEIPADANPSLVGAAVARLRA